MGKRIEVLPQVRREELYGETTMASELDGAITVVAAKMDMPEDAFRDALMEDTSLGVKCCQALNEHKRQHWIKTPSD